MCLQILFSYHFLFGFDVQEGNYRLEIRGCGGVEFLAFHVLLQIKS